MVQLQCCPKVLGTVIFLVASITSLRLRGKVFFNNAKRELKKKEKPTDALAHQLRLSLKDEERSDVTIETAGERVQ